MIDETLVLNKVIERIQLSDNIYWGKKMSRMANSRIHVAVMVEPYLTKILNGVKTIESRFAKKMTTPWKKVNVGDVVILKKSGGGFVGIFEVGEVAYKELCSLDDIQTLKSQYNDRLCIEDDFWEVKKDSKYVTLISISNLFVFNPIELSFKNRQAWIVFREADMILQSYNKRETAAIYCISGKIGSGKTTISNELSSRINAKRCTVSDCLKKVLVDRGCDAPSREQLQEIGAEYINKGWNYFCSCVLEYVNWSGKYPLIIDGVRHVDFLNTLRLICYPIPIYGIYLEASEETLKEHINKRGMENYNSKHVAEGQQRELLDASDIVIDINEKSVIQIVDEIQIMLSKIDKESQQATDNTVTINMLKERVDYFNLIRGWKEYHNPRDLTISINLEAAELLEIFQWAGKNQSMDLDKLNKIKEELADVLIYSIDLANACGFDITEIILNKLIMNACKYPSGK